MVKILSLVVLKIFPEKATRSFLSIQSIAAYLPFLSFLHGGTLSPPLCKYSHFQRIMKNHPNSKLKLKLQERIFL